ncbi:hypothetical protein, partial [Amycolatopsis sp. NPDC000740]|uniref:hypothetical protein n=1 Tax=Amycolatopsis sp. NPDC000740 TaxID=3154269 RepID=UPI00331B2E72
RPVGGAASVHPGRGDVPGQDRRNRGEGNTGGSGGDPGGVPGGTGDFDRGDSIVELLQPPEDTSGEDVQALVKDAGVEVMAVEWVYQKFTGTTLTQQFIEPLTGDFSKMSADAEAWRNISEAMKAFSEVMVANEKTVSDSWHGMASLEHKAYVQAGWRAGLAAEAGIASLIAKGFDLLSDTSKKLAAKALDLLKSLIDRLLVMAAEACVPIAGWIADAITALSELLPLINALISIIEMIQDIITKVQDIWNSIKDIGSQLQKIKDVGSIGDLVDIAKNIGGDVGDIKDNAKGIGQDAKDAVQAGKDGVNESREAHAENRRSREGGDSGDGEGDRPSGEGGDRRSGDDRSGNDGDRSQGSGDRGQNQRSQPDGPQHQPPQNHQPPQQPNHPPSQPNHPPANHPPSHPPRRSASGRIHGRID